MTASLVLHTRQLKEDNGKKLKQNAERYGVHEGSPVEVQWAVRRGSRALGALLLLKVAVWLSLTQLTGNINVVVLHWARLVLG